MDLPLAHARSAWNPAGSHIRRAMLTARRADCAVPLLAAARRAAGRRCAMPLPRCRSPPPAIDDTLGKRDTHNASRIFVSPRPIAPARRCAALAEAFQDEATTALLEDVCGVTLAGSFLRIECCLDTDGFWLEPHTDIGAKLFTMLVYLSDHPDAEDWGTDIMDAAGNVLDRASGAFNTGLIFIPAADTWHGFAKRPIRGVRRSLIVNYVKPEWRSRHELAFPTTPWCPPVELMTA